MVSRLFFHAHTHIHTYIHIYIYIYIYIQRTDPLNRRATMQYYCYQQPIIVNRTVLMCFMHLHILYKYAYMYIYIYLDDGTYKTIIDSF
jgi:hypothetical protein